jgi:hypothetical protein
MFLCVEISRAWVIMLHTGPLAAQSRNVGLLRSRVLFMFRGGLFVTTMMSHVRIVPLAGRVLNCLQ